MLGRSRCEPFWRRSSPGSPHRSRSHASKPAGGGEGGGLSSGNDGLGSPGPLGRVFFEMNVEKTVEPRVTNSGQQPAATDLYWDVPHGAWLAASVALGALVGGLSGITTG